MSLTEMLFDGWIAPGEQAVPKSKKYRQATRTVMDMMETLEKELPRKDYDRIEGLLDQKAVEQDLVNKECFRYGVAFGIELMQEIYQAGYFQWKEGRTADGCAEQ